MKIFSFKLFVLQYHLQIAQKAYLWSEDSLMNLMKFDDLNMKIKIKWKKTTFIAFAVIVILDSRFWTSTEVTGDTKKFNGIGMTIGFIR